MRRRPVRHIRRVKTKYGRRRRVINPGVRRMHLQPRDYQFANQSINQKLRWATRLSHQQERLAERASDPTIPGWKKDALKGEIALLNRDKDGFLEDAARLNRFYWPDQKKRRRLIW